MWLNQRTVDAIRMMAILAGRWPASIKASEVSDLTSITLTNVQKTANILAQAGLVETTRGRNGGLRAARAPAAVTVGEVVRAFEPRDCPIGFLAMSEVDTAIARLVFRAHREFFQPLEETSLADLAGGAWNPAYFSAGARRSPAEA